MGALASKPQASSDCQSCVRKHGDPGCLLHPGKTLTLFCSECKILVCYECITSPEHMGHTFIKIKECLRNAEDKIVKRLEDIDKIGISHLDSELSSVTEEIRIRQLECKTKEVQLNKVDKIKQFRRYYDIVIISLRNYETLLKMYKQQLPKEHKKYANIMKSGSDILRYDTGAQLTTDIMDEIQSRPIIPELTNIKQFDKVMRKLQQEIGRISTTYCDFLNAYANGVTSCFDINLMVNSVFDIVSLRYYNVSPVSADTAWVGESVYDKHLNKYYNSKNLHLITSAGTVLHRFELNCGFFPLGVHPITEKLYCGAKDKTVRSIDTKTGSTTTVIHCECYSDIFKSMKITCNDHVLVGTRVVDNVCRFKFTGELVHKSAEKYKVVDIDHCPTSNRVLLSCGYSGVVVLDNHLARINTFTGLSGQERKLFKCNSAIFDNNGNSIVCDYCNNEIFILDTISLSLIHKLHIDGLASPFKIRLYQNTLWVICEGPDKIMCIMMPF